MSVLYHSTASYEWKVSDSPNNKWLESKDFTLPDNIDMKFKICLKLLEPKTFFWRKAQIRVKKQASIGLGRADIIIQVDKVSSRQTMIHWGDYSDIFNFRGTFKQGVSIICEIHWYGLDDAYENDEIAFAASIQPNSMKNYLLSTELSDVMITINGDELPAHKLVLGSHSTVFSKMFNTDMKEANENCICLDRFDLDIIKQVLMFMYTGKIQTENDINVILKILSCAEMYQIKKLTTFCQYKLIQNFKEENVIEILVDTDNYDLIRLNQRALEFLVDNKANISFSKTIEQINNSKVLKNFVRNELGMRKN
ncbi:Similar to Tdpoz2: TD and POZ domain-containing protein 2 (Mus musculus) [Cotesia congregata]|uniref:Similar to Tdpoz2: TD and POZ domain-containing protein 2 (Mus musculus) n=1 Tax=Cotesia congregata TaxID=51543 RepID=A0A8J2EII9_COTCN|nr:Similar to Tdpoz2: TD and POZ domain-containing protein 2 (Mus musculus) [Cotesia congregata]